MSNDTDLLNSNKGFFHAMDPDILDKQQSTWVGGPTHSIQDQHIPLYTGHIHGSLSWAGLESENLFGKPYAKLTNESFRNREERGTPLSPVYRGVHATDYRTIYKENFEHPRKQAVQYTGDANVTINKNRYQTDILLEHKPATPNPDAVAPIDRIPVVGYQGYNPTFMNPLRKFKRLEELKKMYDSGWVPPVKENVVKDLAEVDAPCVGYTGFLKGKKAENVHGQTFQKTALESIIRRKNEETK